MPFRGGGISFAPGDDGNIVIIDNNSTVDSTIPLSSVMLKDLDAVEGNVVLFDADGNAFDSGIPKSALEIIDGEVNAFADLPDASENNGKIYLVKTTTGVVLVNRHPAGFYVSNGTEWSIMLPVEITGYQKLITTPTNNNLVKTDGNGQTQDAGVAVSIDGNMADNSDAKLPTEKAVRTFLAKTETTVTKYVSDINSSDSNNGNTRFTPYLTVAKAWTDITPSGSVHVLGAGTYNVSHTFASSKQSIKTILESGTKITGTIGLVSGNTSMQFFGGKIQATITDASLGTTYFNNVDMSGSMLTFSGGGYKQITNSPSTPTMITLSNLASGTGTLELNNVIGGIVGISVGTGWTVIYRNTIIATIGAVNGIVVEANNTFCNAVLASQLQLNAISADGYYILNFANPTITGVTVAKGDVIYKAGATILCVYKFSFAPATFAVLDPSNPAQRFTWAKSTDGWVQVGGSSWGSITGTLSAQTDLQNALDLKANQSSTYTKTEIDNALNLKENFIIAGATSQYFRGDKTFQTLDKTAVGLSNVDNTSDLNKPVSTVQQTAIDLKVNKSGDSLTGNLSFPNNYGIANSVSSGGKVIFFKDESNNYVDFLNNTSSALRVDLLTSNLQNSNSVVIPMDWKVFPSTPASQYLVYPEPIKYRYIKNGSGTTLYVEVDANVITTADMTVNLDRVFWNNHGGLLGTTYQATAFMAIAQDGTNQPIRKNSTAFYFANYVTGQIGSIWRLKGMFLY